VTTPAHRTDTLASIPCPEPSRGACTVGFRTIGSFEMISPFHVGRKSREPSVVRWTRALRARTPGGFIETAGFRGAPDLVNPPDFWRKSGTPLLLKGTLSDTPGNLPEGRRSQDLPTATRDDRKCFHPVAVTRDQQQQRYGCSMACAGKVTYSCLQFDGAFLKKHTQDFLFTCGARPHRHPPQPAALGNLS